MLVTAHGAMHVAVDAMRAGASDVLEKPVALDALEVLLAEGGLTGGNAGRTFPADRPRFVIDWILVSEQLALHRYEVIPSMDSDHRPVLARIAFEEPPGIAPTDGASARADGAAPSSALTPAAETVAATLPPGQILAFDGDAGARPGPSERPKSPTERAAHTHAGQTHLKP